MTNWYLSVRPIDDHEFTQLTFSSEQLPPKSSSDEASWFRNAPSDLTKAKNMYKQY